MKTLIITTARDVDTRVLFQLPESCQSQTDWLLGMLFLTTQVFLIQLAAYP